MKFKFFIIPAVNSCDEEEIFNKFCVSHRIAALEKYFVNDGQNSFWSFCITYLDELREQKNIKKSKIDYREVLNEKDFHVFVKLRSLRKKIAEEQGIPVYALFTNDQLAQMITKKVTTISALQEIKGIGKSRIENYGKSFLIVLKKEFLENEKILEK